MIRHDDIKADRQTALALAIALAQADPDICVFDHAEKFLTFIRTGDWGFDKPKAELRSIKGEKPST